MNTLAFIGVLAIIVTGVGLVVGILLLIGKVIDTARGLEAETKWRREGHDSLREKFYELEGRVRALSMKP